MGFLSDYFCRRKTLLLLHVLAPILLIWAYFFSGTILPIVLFGFIYSPLAIVRANLIDNTKEHSRIKLLSLSFIIQFFPETLTFLFHNLEKMESLLWSLGLLIFSFLVGLFFFFDRRDKEIKQETFSKKVSFMIPHHFSGFLTFLAFIPVQIAYFISDNLLEVFSLSPLYYSLLSFGSLVGASVSSIYRKTPHISVLTIAYGFAFLISLLPISAKYLYGYNQLDLPFLFVMMGSLVGFYLPFVYDVILRFSNKVYRGTICGAIDFIYSGASLVTLFIFKPLSHHLFASLALVVFCFGVALIFQKAAEGKTVSS